MLALYRKYRPKVLADVVGQEQVTELLRNAARMDRLAHAYLFFGNKGSGKTTTARIVAKVANCKTRYEDAKFKETGEPCNTCVSCREIDEGRALDVIEIDAASNRGIDEIRNLKENIRISPTSSHYKVYIIDEAHQLTKDAFNALLKTLEEPPAHAMMILVTTETEKMPATIVSRAQRYHFKKLPLATIVEKLGVICKTEGIEAHKDALELIAASGGGSLRDAESLLDQIASLETDNEISAADVERTIGQAGFSRVSKLAEMIFKEELTAALEYIHEVNESGYNVVQFAKDLIHYVRRALTLRYNPELIKLYAQEFTDHEVKLLKTHADLLQPQKTITLIKSLIRAYSEMRYSPFAVIPLEVAVIENLKEGVSD